MQEKVQSQNEVTSSSTDIESPGVSFTKVHNFEASTPSRESTVLDGYRILDVEILSELIQLLCCPECKTPRLTIHEVFSKKFGLASLLNVNCKCGYNTDFCTSRKCFSGGSKAFDVNRRTIYSMRACGQGHAGLEKFCALMNIPRPMTQNSYDNIASTIISSVKLVAEETMAEAAQEIHEKGELDEDGVTNTGISNDGTWQRRGFSSYNGCVAAISMVNGKVLDITPLSRYCKACHLMEKKEKTYPESYQLWKTTHKCNVNHIGSAPGMEVTGTKLMFQRSIEKYQLRYTRFYGDGDSKSFSAVENIYEGHRVKKLECVGHVQKRVGTRLRKLKQEVKGIGGKGKLTNVIIDRLQNYYGIAIRSNVNNLEGMRSDILASLFHVASSKSNNWHSYCPTGESSW